jgi:hypothetical protein
MVKRPDTPCAGGCGKLLWSGGTGSLPAGKRTCRECRGHTAGSCSLEGCDRRHYAKGKCRRHYYADYRAHQREHLG